MDTGSLLDQYIDAKFLGNGIVILQLRCLEVCWVNKDVRYGQTYFH